MDDIVSRRCHSWCFGFGSIPRSTQRPRNYKLNWLGDCNERPFQNTFSHLVLKRTSTSRSLNNWTNWFCVISRRPHWQTVEGLPEYSWFEHSCNILPVTPTRRNFYYLCVMSWGTRYNLQCEHLAIHSSITDIGLWGNCHRSFLLTNCQFLGWSERAADWMVRKCFYLLAFSK